MPNYGFAIDLRKCIGCHACTIACKAEHQIPVGVNRCWVKTVEKGTFPDTRRFFFPVLCNQCDDAPCVSICPTNALFKRRDGIVDLNGESCIGCRACMEACPYDQLFIDPNTHTAEKCNFCANRVENKLLPACVSVCPTECRIFGDLDDPASEVAKIVQREAFMVRKPEKGTGPKIFYLGAEESVIRPEASVRPLYYKEGQVHLRPLGAPLPDPEAPGDPRVDYDVPHGKPWGIDMVLYLVFKAISTGAMIAAALLWLLGAGGSLALFAAPVLSLVFVTLTAVVLIVDLERPERFYYILTRSNWRSWMVWGAYFLTGARRARASRGSRPAWFGSDAALTWLAVPVLVISVLATSYTGFLFAQGLGRDLWQGPSAAIDLVAQSGVAGAAALLIAALVVGDPGPAAGLLGWMLALSLGAHLVILVVRARVLAEPDAPPRAGDPHDPDAVRTRRLFWGGAIVLGGVVPRGDARDGGRRGLPCRRRRGGACWRSPAGAAWEYIWVEAGQSVPLS